MFIDLKNLDLEYDSLMEVMTEVRDVYIIDLARYVKNLPPSYETALLAEPRGVYMKGKLEPILNFESRSTFRTLSCYKNHGQPNILTFDDFIQSNEPVVTDRGRVISPCPSRLKDLYQPTCTYNYSAIHLAAALVWKELSSLHRSTRVTSNLPTKALNEYHWVKDEKIEEFDHVENRSNCDLIESVLKFVGKDTRMLYSVKLKNTALHIEKGNDYRVIEYYRWIFDQLEKLAIVDFEKNGF